MKRVTLIVDAEWRDGPTLHKSTGSQPGDGTIEFLRSQALDALCDLSVEIGGRGWISFGEVGDRLDDVGDRLFGVSDLQRPRAASMI